MEIKQHSIITNVEKAKEKAKKLKGEIAGIYQTTSILVGKVEEVKLEKLWSMGILFCRIRLKNVKKFDLEGNLISQTEEELIYVNKPEFIFSLKELEKANQKVFKSFISLL
ncbi:MAG TPA: hypothetical protein EYH56_02035 [Nanoarchaeota archaeon]|nr:hypothetical protein [Nanoarchaeota archaeon]